MAATSKKALLLPAILIFVAGCAHFRVEIPRGFAGYDEREGVVKAASPDGVVFRVRTIANEPYAELPFWREALCTKMRNAGYRMVDSSQMMSTAAGPAALVELAAPLGNEGQSFLVAVIFDKKKLIIVEAAGEVLKFQKRKTDIIEAIKKISL